MKLLILSLLVSTSVFASSPSKDSSIIDFLSISLDKNEENQKTISVMIGYERKKLILNSINSLCEKKNLECEVSDDNKIPLSKIILKANGSKEDLMYLEKQIN